MADSPWLTNHPSYKKMMDIQVLLYDKPFEKTADEKPEWILERKQVHCRFEDEKGNHCGMKLLNHGSLYQHMKSHKLGEPQNSGLKGGRVPVADRPAVLGLFDELLATHERLSGDVETSSLVPVIVKKGGGRDVSGMIDAAITAGAWSGGKEKLCTPCGNKKNPPNYCSLGKECANRHLFENEAQAS